MPKCGSQVILCDLPIRFDTYKGCSHACEYCFVQRNADITQIQKGESVQSLINWIEGKRDSETEWCDWNIPLHWGGMSDPFQPAEKLHKTSLECLKVFAKTKYPFVVSTKNKMVMEEPYFSLIKECNCVFQFSIACRSMDALEKGASTFEERLEAARAIAGLGKRVIMRVQPYVPLYKNEVYKALKEFADAGVYGCVFESMKYQKKMPNTIKLGGDFVYPTKLLKEHFLMFRNECHRLGMKFYSGENRLRKMGDSLCCCGIDGLEGFRGNTANLNHILYDKEGVVYTPGMHKIGTAMAFRTMYQTSKAGWKLKTMTYKEAMEAHVSKNWIATLVEDGVIK